MTDKNYLLSQEVAEKKMKRMALEIVEQLSIDVRPLILIGIRENGLVMARNIHSLVHGLLPAEVRCISCTIDKKEPGVVEYSEETDFSGLNVIVIDDVINSGRTLLYALKPLLSYKPNRIQTLCLVERMHKAFPIKPDYVGLSVATTLLDHIQVEVHDQQVTGAYLCS